ncbi:MAG: hypothetical protein HY754_06450 [Nitrospirae bacterium]|nr:hypothetical protein [Nitrospirota bacterium]
MLSFSLPPKVAFVTLVQRSAEKKIHFIDCQITTEHLKNFGAKEMLRARFLKLLERALKSTTSS